MKWVIVFKLGHFHSSCSYSVKGTFSLLLAMTFLEVCYPTDSYILVHLQIYKFFCASYTGKPTELTNLERSAKAT